MRKLNVAICIAALGLFALLAGCGDVSEGKLESTDIPLDSIVAINVESDMGDIHIEPGSGRVIQIIPTYTVTSKERQRRDILGSAVLVTTDTSDPALLTILSRRSDNVTLREDESVKINLTVRVPEKIGSVVIQSGEGDISIEKMSCAFSIVNNSGRVVANDSYFTGKSSIVCVVGDVDVRLKGIAAAQEIYVATDVGEINFNCPKRAAYTVIVEENSQTGSAWTNKLAKSKDTPTKITLSTKVGSIQFQKKPT